MPTVSAPTSRAMRATTGAAPEPVPPPSPAVTKTMSEPRRTCLIWSYDSSAARRPTTGSAPEPSPWVSSLPIWSFTGASEVRSCWMSVLTAMNSTCEMPASIMRLTAFRPAPPTPITRMTARYAAESARGTRERRGAVAAAAWAPASRAAGAGAAFDFLALSESARLGGGAAPAAGSDVAARRSSLGRSRLGLPA